MFYDPSINIVITTTLNLSIKKQSLIVVQHADATHTNWYVNSKLNVALVPTKTIQPNVVQG